MLSDDVRLSIITATIGRRSFQWARDSLVGACISETDEWIVVADGPEAEARIEPWRQDQGPNGARVVWTSVPVRLGGWGGGARNHALTLATGTHVMYLDDDDVLAPASLSTVKLYAARHPGQVLFFRCQRPEGDLFWRTEHVAQGNVGTGNVVLPRSPLLAPWTSRYEGDFDHISGSIAALGTVPVFVDFVLTLTRLGERKLPEGIMEAAKTNLLSDGQPCVICSVTGAIIFLHDAVMVGGKWVSKDLAPAEALSGGMELAPPGDVEVNTTTPTPTVPTASVKKG